MRVVFVITVLSVVGFSTALYQQCPNTKAVENLDQLVSVSNCKKAPCRLRKGTATGIEIKFKPDREIKSIQNTVTADIAGIPFPFIGVDGTSACNQIFEADGTTKASCPLKAGTDYVYKNKIDVLEIYPRLKVIVTWALQSPGIGNVACFRVPAKITN